MAGYDDLFGVKPQADGGYDDLFSTKPIAPPVVQPEIPAIIARPVNPATLASIAPMKPWRQEPAHGPFDSLGTVASKFGQNILPMFQRQAGGLAMGAGSAMRVPGAPEYDAALDRMSFASDLGGLRDWGNDLFHGASEELAKNQPNIEPDSALYHLNNIATAGVNMVPSIATGIATRRPNVGLGLMGAQVYGDRYGELKEKGLSDAEAGQGAYYSTLAETLTEKIPMGILTREGGKLIWRATKAGMAEGAQEGINELLQLGYDIGVLDESVTPEEVYRRVKDATIAGAGLGSSMAVVTQPFTPKQQAQSLPPDEIEEIRRALYETPAEPPSPPPAGVQQPGADNAPAAEQQPPVADSAPYADLFPADLDYVEQEPGQVAGEQGVDSGNAGGDVITRSQRGDEKQSLQLNEDGIITGVLGEPVPQAQIITVPKSLPETGEWYVLRSVAKDDPNIRASTFEEALSKAIDIGYSIKEIKDPRHGWTKAILVHQPTQDYADAASNKFHDKWDNADNAWVRYGELPEGGRSKNYAENALEPGVSVFSGKVVPGTDEGMALPKYNQELGSYLSLLSRPLYQVEGEFIGNGSDGEPVLRNARIIRQLNQGDLDDIGIRSSRRKFRDDATTFSERRNDRADYDSLPAEERAVVDESIAEHPEGRRRVGSDFGQRPGADSRVTSAEEAVASLNLATPITVLANPSELPEAIRNKLDARSMSDQGIWTNRGIYLFADNIAGTDYTRAVQTTAIHEAIGHDGLRAILGDKLDATLDAIWRDQERAVRQINDRKNLGLDLADLEQRREAVEEFIAYTTERHVQAAKDGTKLTLPAWLSKLLVKLRNALRHIAPGIKQWSQAELLDLIARAHKATGTTVETTSKPQGDIRSHRGNVSAAGIKDRLDHLRYYIQDKLIDLKRQQEPLGQLPDEANPYQKAAIWEGKAGERLNDFDERRVQPLLEKIAETGMPMEEVGNWLVARHADEANRYLWEINEKRYGNEPEKRAMLSGMESAFTLQANNRTGQSEAEQILAQHANNQALQNVGRMIDQINRERVRMLVNQGLLAQDEANAWQSRYQHYVPLHREEAVGVLDGMLLPGRGQGFQVRGKESKQRTGSADWTPSMVIGYTLTQFENSVVRVGKNEVAQALLELVNQHPDPTFWEERTRPKQATVRDGQVVDAPRMIPAQNELVVKKDGKEHWVWFNPENERAMRLVSGMKNLQAGDLGWILRRLAGLNRFLSHINTGWNPEFVISNFARDIQTAGYNLQNTELKNRTMTVMKDVPNALKGIVSALRGNGAHPWAAVYDEFRKHGGKTGWIDLHSDVKARERDLAAIVERIRAGKPAKGHVRRLFDAVDDWNAVIENGVRLAAYKQARDIGLSPDKAAALAKDLTVNFNRKGAMGPAMNAMYLFYNASIQGNVRMLQTMLRSPRARKFAYSTIGFAVMLDIINRSLAGEDDDGENLYDTLPSHVKAHNLIIMGEKEPLVKLPLPWGYNVLHAIGQSVGTMLTSERANALDQAAHVATALIDAFNPVGSGTPMQIISPTVVDPFTQIAENKNFAGNPVKPEQMPFGPGKPESEMYFRSAREGSKDVARWLNEYSDGNEVRPGWLDVSPEWIDLFIDHFTGGAGRFTANTADTMQRILTGKEIETQNVPFVRKLTGYNNEYGVKSRYYEWSKDVAIAKNEIRTLKGEQLEKARRNPAVKLINDYSNADSQIRDLREIRRDMVKRDAPESEIDKIDEKIRKVMAQFNRKYAAKVLNEGQ